MSALKGKGKSERVKPLYWKMASAWPVQKTRPFHWVSWAVVDQNWKLVANKDFSYWELYDIVADPFEKRDLKDEKPETAQQLLKQLTVWKATLPETPNGNVFSEERSQ